MITNICVLSSDNVIKSGSEAICFYLLLVVPTIDLISCKFVGARDSMSVRVSSQTDLVSDP